MFAMPKQPREQKDYIAYIDEQYNSERLTNILTTLTEYDWRKGAQHFPARIMIRRVRLSPS